MTPLDAFGQGIYAAVLALALAGVWRVLRPLHVRYLVEGRNPWGRKFDFQSATKQNRRMVNWGLVFAAAFLAYGAGAAVFVVADRMT